MNCILCQDFETSHQASGDAASVRAIADMALELQGEDCHNINLVSPTQHSPHLVDAV